jgi:hypothetical protein
MNISKIKTNEDVIECVNMYFDQNDHLFLEANFRIAVKNLDIIIRRNKFVRILKESDKIVAWMYADTYKSLHSDFKAIQQYYYCSTLKGTKAFKAVKLLHEDLVKYAIENKYEFVMSPGSHLDPDYTFTRILEKLGWERRGYIALYKTPYYRGNAD